MEINTDKHGLPNPDGTWGERETLPWDGTPGKIQLLGTKNQPSSVRLAGGFNLLNPFSWHKTREVRDAVQSGDSNVEFSNSPTGSYLQKINEQQRMLREMGY
jgi:hypothetical protein